ncbi:MAG: hypothetical protein KGY80_02815 [Candidatus Thorarchaeota archaeon]|nr:hypothetical protein [Candidatus Thorarchaeota archaeon]
MGRKSDAQKIGEILISLGGIVGVLFGILASLGSRLALIPDFVLIGGLDLLISGIVLIVLSVLVLATNRTINIKSLCLKKNWIVLLILGVLMYVFRGDLAAILVIIGAILLLF